MSARKTLHGEWLDLHHAPGSAGIARLGLVIPKRLAKHSVLRNAIRRQAREAFRQQAVELPVLDLVLRLVRPLKGLSEVKDEQKRQVRSDIERLIARLCGLQKI